MFGSPGHQGLRAYKAVVLGQEDCDARVYLANSQRDQHGEWKSGASERDWLLWWSEMRETRCSKARCLDSARSALSEA